MTYDCFPFLNELDLLEVRLHELDQVVDRFVLVESTRTFSGQRKPLHFARSARRFQRWRSRIRHVVVDDMPDSPDPWVRDHFQRNCIARGLLDCGPDDVILVSDADEIPRASRVAERRGAPGIQVFEQALCYYFLNNRAREPWLGTRMCSFDTFCRTGGAQSVRASLGSTVRDGGWHFSYMGGAGNIRSKIQAYAHQEYNTPEYAGAARVGRVLISNADLFDRDLGWTVRPEADMPQYVADHRNRFADWIWEGPLSEVWGRAGCDLTALTELWQRVASLDGDVVVLGGADVRVIVTLANEAHPQPVLAVGTWTGAESGGAASPAGGDDRAKLASFLRSVRLLTAGNVQPIAMETDPFLRAHSAPIKLCYLGGETSAGALRRRIAGLLPRVVPGGIIAGDGGLARDPRLGEALDELLPRRAFLEEVWHGTREATP